MVPGEMICRKIDEDKHRPGGPMLGDRAGGGVEEEAVGLQIPRTEVVLIVEALHAGRRLEIPRAHERAERWIKRESAIATALQRRRQAAIDSSGRNARDKIGEAAERSRRQAREHIVLGVPARPAVALDQKITLLAVERLEMRAI